MNIKTILYTIRNGLFNEDIAHSYVFVAVSLLLIIHIGFSKRLGYSIQDIIALYPPAFKLFLIAVILISMFWISKFLEVNGKKICEKHGVDVIE